MIHAFISSVHKEFSKVRENIKQAQERKGRCVYLFERDTTTRAGRERVKAALQRSDVVICVFGREMGHVPDTDENLHLGVTCLETLWAGDFDKPLYLLVQDVKNRDERLEKFLRPLGEFSHGKWLKPFKLEKEIPDLVDQCIDDYCLREHVDSEDRTLDWRSVSGFVNRLRSRLEKEQFEYHTDSSSFIEPAANVQGRPTVDGAALSESWRRQPAEDYGFIEPEFRRPRKLVRLINRVRSSYTPPSDASALRTSRIRNVTKYLRNAKRVTVLKGEPGSGKTTAMRFIALQLLADAVTNPQKAPLIPLFFRLNQYRAMQPGTTTLLSRPGRLDAFMLDEIEGLCVTDGDDFRVLRQSLNTLRRQGRILFLFDALDELPLSDRLDRQRLLRHLARDLIQSKNRVIFSCRVADYMRGFRADEVLLSPFDRKRVRRFIRNHLDSHLSDYAPYLTHELLNPARDIHTLCQNPFYLQLFVLYLNVAQDYRRALTQLLEGDNLGPVFEGVVRHKFKRVLQRSRHLTEADEKLFRGVLGRLAVSLFRGESHDGPPLPEGLLESESTADVRRVQTAALEERLLVRSDSGGVLFRHARLQEYFAAAAMAETGVLPNAALPRRMDGLENEEVVVLYSAMTRDPGPLIDALLAASAPKDAGPLIARRHRSRMTLLAARCIGALPGRKADQQEAVQRSLKRQLYEGETLEKIESIRGLRCVMSEPEYGSLISSITDRSVWVQETVISQLQTTTLPLKARARALRRSFGRISSIPKLGEVVAKNLPYLRSPSARLAVLIGSVFLVWRVGGIGLGMLPSVLLIRHYGDGGLTNHKVAAGMIASLVFIVTMTVLALRTGMKTVTIALIAGLISMAGAFGTLTTLTLAKEEPVRSQGVDCEEHASVTLACSTVHGNSGGDYVGCLADDKAVRGNLDRKPETPVTPEENCKARPECCPEGVAIVDGPAVSENDNSRYPPETPPDALIVDGTGKEGFTTIQAAIDASPSGGVIAIKDGDYSGPGNVDLRVAGRNVIITSVSGDPTKCKIDCKASAEEPHRGMYFAGGTTSQTRVWGISIHNCYVTPKAGFEGAGGGILLDKGASPTLGNILFVGNYASSGGAALHTFGSTEVNFSFLGIEDSRGKMDTCALRIGPASTGRIVWSNIVNNQTRGLCVGRGSGITIDWSTIADNVFRNQGSGVSRIPEVPIAVILLVINSLGIMAQVCARNLRGHEDPIKKTREAASLRSQLAETPVAALAPFLVTGGFVVAGIWLTGGPNISAWASLVVFAVVFVGVLLWAVSGTLQYRQEFEALVRKVYDGPTKETGLAVLTYLRGNVPDVYKTRAARLVGDIEEADARFIELLWHSATDNEIPAATREELWKSTQEIEKLYWGNIRERQRLDQ